MHIQKSFTQQLAASASSKPSF